MATSENHRKELRQADKPETAERFMNMNTNVKVDFLQKKIMVTKSFYRKAQIPMTEEYEMLLQLQRDLPGYTIRIAEPPRRDNKRLYPTYDEMSRFIRLNGDDDEEFREVMDIARSCAYRNPYNYVRQWFFKNYPMYDGEDFRAA